ncbi:ABA4-like family protein [Sandaracinobacteroides saxicola]|uniref:DUF4281 domain-containing protein n=1 Tax=Sandaracinobacteroides saxicola TaxID=2759707 RepID=A0A7G5IJ90_9SPHN|nr:ABA4-like family protein [Sandaracinobacteroides saxicola]QMW23432.1 DUF4281 domain-containing protein [Sandaracinobacteroides saxicola]
MTPEKLFSLANGFAMLGWLALALLTPFRRPLAIQLARWVAAITCGFYATLLIHGLAFGQGAPEGAGFTSLAGVMLLFQTPQAVLAGWAHYLAFDLFVATWEAEDAERSNVPTWALYPCFFLTLMSGPIGLLLYLSIRAFRQRR